MEWSFIHPHLRERTFKRGELKVGQKILVDPLERGGRCDAVIDGVDWILREETHCGKTLRSERHLNCSSLDEALKEADWWAAVHTIREEK